MTYDIYTDGACSGNPGPGGWGAILMYKDAKKEISGGCKQTTNNIMEITAVVEALKCLKVESNVQVYSDSAYCINCYQDHWYLKWQMNGWLNSKKQPVANKELWEKLIPYFNDSRFSFKKVKGHSGNQLNELVDKMAVAARQENSFI